MTATKPRPPRSRLLPADVLRTGTLGLRYRRGRSCGDAEKLPTGWFVLGIDSSTRA